MVDDLGQAGPWWGLAWKVLAAMSRRVFVVSSDDNAIPTRLVGHLRGGLAGLVCAVSTLAGRAADLPYLPAAGPAPLRFVSPVAPLEPVALPPLPALSETSRSVPSPVLTPALVGESTNPPPAAGLMP